MPLSKGLDPIRNSGLAPNMMTAFVAAAFYHLFLMSSLSNGIMDVEKKAHLMVALFFVAHGMAMAFHLPFPFVPKAETVKKEKTN